MTKTKQLLAASFATLLGMGSQVQAAPQGFAYSYEAATLSKGAKEFETNVTWGHLSDEDSFSFEHELEYGISDKLQLSALLKWDATDTDAGSEAKLHAVGLEAIYLINSPAKGDLGVGLLGESVIGSEVFTLEGKLLLQKSLGPINAVYNIGAEAAWEGDNYDERVGEFSHSIGMNYKVSNNLTLGVEAVQVLAWADWKTQEENTVYLGPNIGLRFGNFWLSAVASWQVSSQEDAPDFQGKLRVGFVF